MISCNIILTCAGRRNYLVGYFRDALGSSGRVYVADASPDAPAMQEADRSFVVPAVSAPEYIDALLDLCQDNGIRLLIPLNDLELPILAPNRQRFIEAGVLPVISSPQVIDVCFDKWRTVEFLKNAGIRVPETYTCLADAQEAIARGLLSFPVVIKPRWGTASIGIEYPEDMDELVRAYQLARKRIMRTMLASASAGDSDRSILIQEKLRGAEYGMDVVNDLEGRHVCTFVKRKLAMRAGETDRAITVRDANIEKLGAMLGSRLAHVGNLDCDVFVQEGVCTVLEMNPRFGGGYPFSHLAGANIPAAIIAWSLGLDSDPNWLRVSPDVFAAKCDRLVTRGRSLVI